ncbi:uncharacterized protein METZ01_LOCUS475999, partial [marine metagenome]
GNALYVHFRFPATQLASNLLLSAIAQLYALSGKSCRFRIVGAL